MLMVLSAFQKILMRNCCEVVSLLSLSITAHVNEY